MLLEGLCGFQNSPKTIAPRGRLDGAPHSSLASPDPSPGSPEQGRHCLRLIQGKEKFLGLLNKYMEIHGTVYYESQRPPEVPAFVKNHGLLPQPEFQQLLRKAKVSRPLHPDTTWTLLSTPLHCPDPPLCTLHFPDPPLNTHILS